MVNKNNPRRLVGATKIPPSVVTDDVMLRPSWNGIESVAHIQYIHNMCILYEHVCTCTTVRVLTNTYVVNTLLWHMHVTSSLLMHVCTHNIIGEILSLFFLYYSLSLSLCVK